MLQSLTDTGALVAHGFLQRAAFFSTYSRSRKLPACVGIYLVGTLLSTPLGNLQTLRSLLLPSEAEQGNESGGSRRHTAGNA